MALESWMWLVPPNKATPKSICLLNRFPLEMGQEEGLVGG